MKKKIDYNFIIFLVIISIFGLALIYLVEVKNQLIRDKITLQTLSEQQTLFYKNTVDLYFTSLQCETLNFNNSLDNIGQKILKDYDPLILKEKIIVCFLSILHDSLEIRQFIYTLDILKDVSKEHVIVLSYPGISDGNNELLKGYDYKILILPKLFPKIPDKSVFYLDDQLQVKMCFKIENYTLHLFKKYVNLLFNMYPELK